jgi:hypothetical protein
MPRRLLIAAGLTLALSGTALAGTIPSTPTKNDAKYVNPFANPAWIVGRTDMGVDWVPTHRLPVLAAGDAVVVGSSSHSGWPGGGFIYYQLLDGPLAGDYVYVAEHLRKLLPAGRVVHAGQQIALGVPGYPYIETGWADQYGSPRAYPCYKEGHRTNSGKEMSRFLTSLGAPVGEPPGTGPSGPTGKLC